MDAVLPSKGRCSVLSAPRLHEVHVEVVKRKTCLFFFSRVNSQAEIINCERRASSSRLEEKRRKEAIPPVVA